MLKYQQTENEKSSKRDDKVPSTIPRNLLYSLSFIEMLSLVPPRTCGFEFTSSKAVKIATFATLPIVELKGKIAPMFTTLGLVETTLVVTAL